MINWLKRIYYSWHFSFVDERLCCCGCNIGEGGSICGHGGCRSVKEYAITCCMEGNKK